jgi:hypothetical protein
MKKVTIVFSLLVLSIVANAQKAELVQKIKEDYAFMQAVVVENMMTLNLSETMWANVLNDDNFPQGKKHFSSLGIAMIECHDIMFDTKMIGKCDGSSYPTDDTKTDCEKEIIADKSKLHITVNAANIKYTEMSYRLMFGYLTCIDDFLGNSATAYGFNRNWRPKTSELHFVLTLSETAKDVTVVWSTDGKTATITAPVSREVEEWGTKIGKGLTRGGNTIK